MRDDSTQVSIIALSADAAQERLPELVALLRDAVDHGASVSFISPLSESEGHEFWESVVAEMTAGQMVLLVALLDGHVVGSAQLALANKPNARHRAEVQKVLVLHAMRRRGIGYRLMEAIENEARNHDRRLLVLDTRTGDDGERLYRRIGYQCVGTIPGFALNAEGGLDATTIYYKILDS